MPVNHLPSLLHIFGAGKVGQTFGYLLSHLHFTVGQVLCRHFENAQKATQFLKAGTPQTSFVHDPTPALFLLTTPDQILPEIVEQLRSVSLARSYVLHFSGSLPSTLLHPLHSSGALVASLHPLKSFALPQESANSFAGTFCAYEGDAAFLPLLRQLILDLQGIPCLIAPQHKALYHLGAVVASNYLLGLLQFALELFQQANIPEKEGLPALLSLISGTLENTKKVGPKRALTGPIQRGDISTLKLHLQQLSPPDRLLYQALGKKCLSLTTLSEAQKKVVESLLE